MARSVWAELKYNEPLSQFVGVENYDKPAEEFQQAKDKVKPLEAHIIKSIDSLPSDYVKAQEHRNYFLNKLNDTHSEVDPRIRLSKIQELALERENYLNSAHGKGIIESKNYFDTKVKELATDKNKEEAHKKTRIDLALHKFDKQGGTQLNEYGVPMTMEHTSPIYVPESIDLEKQINSFDFKERGYQNQSYWKDNNGTTYRYQTEKGVKGVDPERVKNTAISYITQDPKAKEYVIVEAQTKAIDNIQKLINPNTGDLYNRKEALDIVNNGGDMTFIDPKTNTVKNVNQVQYFKNKLENDFVNRAIEQRSGYISNFGVNEKEQADWKYKLSGLEEQRQLLNVGTRETNTMVNDQDNIITSQNDNSKGLLLNPAFREFIQSKGYEYPKALTADASLTGPDGKKINYETLLSDGKLIQEFNEKTNHTNENLKSLEQFIMKNPAAYGITVNKSTGKASLNDINNKSREILKSIKENNKTRTTPYWNSSNQTITDDKKIADAIEEYIYPGSEFIIASEKTGIGGRVPTTSWNGENGTRERILSMVDEDGGDVSNVNISVKKVGTSKYNPANLPGSDVLNITVKDKKGKLYNYQILTTPKKEVQEIYFPVQEAANHSYSGNLYDVKTVQDPKLGPVEVFNKPEINKGGKGYKIGTVVQLTNKSLVDLFKSKGIKINDNGEMGLETYADVVRELNLPVLQKYQSNIVNEVE